MTKWMPDGAGTRARMGVLTPHFDPVPESEFQALAPVGVSLHAARVPLGMVGLDGEIIPHVDADIAKAFAAPPEVDDATSLLSAVQPTAIIFAFTSSSYILGYSGDTELRARLTRRANGVPIVIQSSALVSGLRALGKHRISLVHPPWFSDELDALGARYFEDHGIEVLNHGQAKLRKEYGDMANEQILGWLLETVPETADAIVIGGGGFRAIGTLREAERRLSRPVLSANQAAFWLAMRLSGVEDRLDGYGSLFGISGLVP